MIVKNFKLLFRNKESAYTIIFGPILIILLVSFAFMGASDEYTVNVGTYVPEVTDLSERTIKTLNKNNYLVSVYPTEETCVSSVESGSTHACLVFSQEESGDETVPITFYLDFSRTNIVYQLLDDLSAEVDIQADAIRSQLALSTLQRMETAAIIVEESYTTAKSAAEQLATISGNLEAARGALTNIPTRNENITDLRLLKGYHHGLAQNAKTISDLVNPIFDEARAALHAMETECGDCTEVVLNQAEAVEDKIEEAETEIYRITEETTDKQLQEADLLMRSLIGEVEILESTIRNATTSGVVITENVDASAADLDNNVRAVEQVVTKLAYAKDFLRGDDLDADTITTPISTSVVSITVTDDTLSFAYPYLLMLVIMFIGMLLSSMMVVTDKISQAAFRNFTTPTSNAFYVFISFLTAFILLAAEVIVMLGISSFFIAQPLFLNPLPTFTLISVAIVLFTFVGMIIGYLSNTQEAAMISSISLGSVLLFVSNLIIPIEGMTGLVQKLTALNPYIVLSELLKKSMLYGVTTGQIVQQLLVLAGLLVVLLFLTALIRQRMKKKYFKQDEPVLVKMHIPAPLRLGNTYVYGPVDLMATLDKMTREEFTELVQKPNNSIAQWVAKELRLKVLAHRLRTTSKEKMILRLDRYLKRHGKKLKR